LAISPKSFRLPEEPLRLLAAMLTTRWLGGGGRVAGVLLLALGILPLAARGSRTLARFDVTRSIVRTHHRGTLIDGSCARHSYSAALLLISRVAMALFGLLHG
jgi:hypothetical protein